MSSTGSRGVGERKDACQPLVSRNRKKTSRSQLLEPVNAVTRRYISCLTLCSVTLDSSRALDTWQIRVHISLDVGLTKVYAVSNRLRRCCPVLFRAVRHSLLPFSYQYIYVCTSRFSFPINCTFDTDSWLPSTRT